MKVIFAWRIDDFYFKRTRSFFLSIGQCTMPSIHRLGLFSCLYFGINGRERFTLARTAMDSSNFVITTSMSVEQSTNAYGSKSLFYATKLLVEFSLSAIDYTRTGPSVTSRKRSDICGLFLGSDVLPYLTSNNLKTTHNKIIKLFLCILHD